MFKEIFSISAMMLLLASFSANATTLQCGDMSPVDCKTELGMQLEKMSMMKIKEMLRDKLKKTIEMYSTIKEDFPADSIHVKVITEATDKMKTAMAMIDKIDEADKEQMERIIGTALVSMEPDFMKSEPEDSEIKIKIKEMLEKHGYQLEFMGHHLLTIMKEIESIWMDLYSGLRETDLKTYPQYMEINENWKKTMETTERENQVIMFITTIKMIKDFNESPILKALLNTMCVGC